MEGSKNPFFIKQYRPVMALRKQKSIAKSIYRTLSLVECFHSPAELVQAMFGVAPAADSLPKRLWPPRSRRPSRPSPRASPLDSIRLVKRIPKQLWRFITT